MKDPPLLIFIVPELVELFAAIKAAYTFVVPALMTIPDKALLTFNMPGIVPDAVVIVPELLVNAAGTTKTPPLALMLIVPVLLEPAGRRTCSGYRNIPTVKQL